MITCTDMNKNDGEMRGYYKTVWHCDRIFSQRAWECSQRNCSSALLFQTGSKHDSLIRTTSATINSKRTNTLLSVMKLPRALPREAYRPLRFFHLETTSSMERPIFNLSVMIQFFFEFRIRSQNALKGVLVWFWEPIWFGSTRSFLSKFSEKKPICCKRVLVQWITSTTP